MTTDPLASLRQVVEELPRERLPAAAGRLAEAQALLQLRLHANGMNEAPKHAEPDPDPLLDVKAAAEMLGVNIRWLYRRADRLPFTRRLGPRTLRFSERGLRRWLETRR